MKLTYCAIPREQFSYRFMISRWVLGRGEVPLNPFMLFDYYLGRDEEDEKVIDACHQLVEQSDLVRVFGNRDKDGVKEEIDIARVKGIPVKFHDVSELTR